MSNSGAFLSYTRFDDEHDDGRITTIRERIAGEVRAQTGERFDIFQDREDISWGQQWKRRIEQTLDAVTFLVPILTPSFFKSTACRDELTRFLKRERDLKRDDLVLPIHYIDCPVLEDREKRTADDLAEIVANRQHVDWRPHRFSNIDSPEVKKLVASMATQLRDAINRTRESTPRIEHKDAQPSRDNTNTLPKNRFADDRLNHPINFGSSFDEIARGFAKRMDEFDALDGGVPDKFRDLGSHVYTSVATCLDRALAYSTAKLFPENRKVLEDLSTRLKQLAAASHDYLEKPFPQYWRDGRKISDDLSAHVAHLNRLPLA